MQNGKTNYVCVFKSFCLQKVCKIWFFDPKLFFTLIFFIIKQGIFSKHHPKPAHIFCGHFYLKNLDILEEITRELWSLCGTVHNAINGQVDTLRPNTHSVDKFKFSGEVHILLEYGYIGYLYALLISARQTPLYLLPDKPGIRHITSLSGGWGEGTKSPLS